MAQGIRDVVSMGVEIFHENRVPMAQEEGGERGPVVPHEKSRKSEERCGVEGGGATPSCITLCCQLE